MQVSLIFPPSWIPSQPFLSLPSLQGFLKKEGVKDVSIRDLNIEIMDALLSSEKVEKTHAKLCRGERPFAPTVPAVCPYGYVPHMGCLRCGHPVQAIDLLRKIR